MCVHKKPVPLIRRGPTSSSTPVVETPSWCPPKHQRYQLQNQEIALGPSPLARARALSLSLTLSLPGPPFPCLLVYPVPTLYVPRPRSMYLFRPSRALAWKLVVSGRV